MITENRHFFYKGKHLIVPQSFYIDEDGLYTTTELDEQNLEQIEEQLMKKLDEK